jgi:peptidoglycan/xylan/chitin deacetylase (PgdA/CDA1 family)
MLYVPGWMIIIRNKKLLCSGLCMTGPTNSGNHLIVTTSWDDGHKCDLVLMKLLDTYGIKGTFYASQKYLDAPLGEQDLKVIDQSHEIGAHTLTHPFLTRLPDDAVRREIVGSKEFLERVLGHEIRMFCYPNGRYNPRIQQMVKSLGFVAARTCTPGSFSLPDDPFSWHVSLHASNGSPLSTCGIWKDNHLPFSSLLDWEIRAKYLFDHACESGGVYHLWGHSWEIEERDEWDKLERVLKYISRRQNVAYLTNGQIFPDE